MDEEGAWFSPRTCGAKRKCCVPKCNVNSEANPRLRFHAFPKEGELVSVFNGGVPKLWDRREYWKRVLKIPKPITRTMFVCSRHFLRSDYLLPDHSAKQRHLKRTVVPTVNLPKDSADEPLVKQPAALTQSYTISGREGLPPVPLMIIKKEAGGGVHNVLNANGMQEEVITDDIPSQEMLMPVPVKLVEVSTGKEIRFNEPILDAPDEECGNMEEAECLIAEKPEENIFEPKIVLIPQKVEDEDYQPPSSEEEDDEDDLDFS